MTFSRDDFVCAVCYLNSFDECARGGGGGGGLAGGGEEGAGSKILVFRDNRVRDSKLKLTRYQ